MIDPRVLPLHTLRPRTGSEPAISQAFAARVLPAFEGALAAAVELPRGLPGPLEDAVRDAVGLRRAPGSRWRPLHTLATARAVGGSERAALPAAVAVELTHTASLVLDDLPCMDDSGERRGIPATHRSVGAGGAILVALALLGRAAELLGRMPDGGPLAARWGEAFGISGMSGGQAADLAGSFAEGGAARRLHRKKTTALSALALEAGARAGGARRDARISLVRFGTHLGWAYQLADDAEDWREDGRLGSPAVTPGTEAVPGARARLASRRYLRRALRHLEHTPGLDPEGRSILDAMARRAVGFPAAGEARRWG
jgi:geranylgeranyl pyrophosphate synthase